MEGYIRKVFNERELNLIARKIDEQGIKTILSYKDLSLCVNLSFFDIELLLTNKLVFKGEEIFDAVLKSISCDADSQERLKHDLAQRLIIVLKNDPLVKAYLDLKEIAERQEKPMFA